MLRQINQRAGNPVFPFSHDVAKFTRVPQMVSGYQRIKNLHQSSIHPECKN
ncbi:Uncharacterized protein dnm_031530 [Desulfonema magnum]|uniref:Uncharacterized protein n=1 Tax=Desulfonema magnum TaxID=45655 RepID=A0A975BKI9_9BACT|nr:Uncharacterized protein dnm_031530 [Desulfonema magnum]